VHPNPFFQQAYAFTRVLSALRRPSLDKSLISPRVLMKVENPVKVDPVGEFELKGIRRPLAAYSVVGLAPLKPAIN